MNLSEADYDFDTSFIVVNAFPESYWMPASKQNHAHGSTYHDCTYTSRMQTNLFAFEQNNFPKRISSPSKTDGKFSPRRRDPSSLSSRDDPAFSNYNYQESRAGEGEGGINYVAS